MSEILKFAAENPILTFFITWFICHYAAYVIIRFARSLTVAFRGWPPAHLDADGDWKPAPKDGDE